LVSSHDIHFIFDRCFHKHINYLPSEFGKLVDEIGSDIQKIKQMGVDHIIFALLPNTQDEIVKVIDTGKELSKFAK
jgi:hypothetical protein